MPLQSSGPISLENVQAEFGGSNPIGIDEYYAITPQVKSRYGYAISASGNSSFINQIGSGGAATHPPSGFTSIQNETFDDAFREIELNFTFKFLGVPYTSIFIGSNTYITFGSGSSIFTSLSSSNPALPKIFIGAFDNSYQRVSFTRGLENSYLRVRYEGTASTSGTLGSPNIVFEIIFFDPRSTNSNNIFQLYVGSHSRLSGLFRICTAFGDVLNLDTGPIANPLIPNTGYLFQSNSNGDNFTVTRDNHFSLNSVTNPISLFDFYGLSGQAEQFVVTSGRVALFNGDGGSPGAWPPTGYTSIQNNTVDDAFVSISLPFTYMYNGTTYQNNIFIGSNTYITFGNGSSNHNVLGAGNPNLPTLHIGSFDNSYQRVAYKSSANFFTVRYEGTASTSGTPGSPNIVWEATFFRYENIDLDSTTFSDDEWGHIIMLNVGNHARTAGNFGISNGSTYEASGTIAAQTSYLIMGRGANAFNQRIQTNARMVNVSQGFN